MDDRYQSLPLFPDEALPAMRSPADDRMPGAEHRRTGAASSSRGGGDHHLIAANRLARAIRRMPDHSPQQTRAGQAICRHLLALLEEAERP